MRTKRLLALVSVCLLGAQPVCAQPPASSRTLVDTLATVEHAPDEDLRALALARRNLLLSLMRDDPTACVDQYYADFPFSGVERLPAVSRQAAAAARDALLNAERSAGSKPVQRPPFDSAINLALAKAIADSGVAPRLQALAAGVEPMSEEEACQAGVIVYAAVSDLPPPQSGAWMAQALKRSGSQRRGAERLVRTSPVPEIAEAARKATPAQFERLVDAQVLASNGAEAAGEDIVRRVLAELAAKPPGG